MSISSTLWSSRRDEKARAILTAIHRYRFGDFLESVACGGVGVNSHPSGINIGLDNQTKKMLCDKFRGHEIEKFVPGTHPKK